MRLTRLSSVVIRCYPRFILSIASVAALPPADAEGLTVKIWSAEPIAQRRRSAA